MPLPQQVLRKSLHPIDVEMACYCSFFVPAGPCVALCTCEEKVYVLEVTWSEGTTTVIYRRYSDFFEFQVSAGLLLLHPSAGLLLLHPIVLPFFFSSSHFSLSFLSVDCWRSFQRRVEPRTQLHASSHFSQVCVCVCVCVCARVCFCVLCSNLLRDPVL